MYFQTIFIYTIAVPEQRLRPRFLFFPLRSICFPSFMFTWLNWMFWVLSICAMLFCPDYWFLWSISCLMCVQVEVELTRKRRENKLRDANLPRYTTIMSIMNTFPFYSYKDMSGWLFMYRTLYLSEEKCHQLCCSDSLMIVIISSSFKPLYRIVFFLNPKL